MNPARLLLGLGLLAVACGAEDHEAPADAACTPGAFAATEAGRLEGSSLSSVTTVDLDGDGRDDLVASARTTSGSRGLAIARATHDGFAPVELVALPECALCREPQAIVAGDLDGDQRPDLVLASSHEGLAVLPNTGGGRLGTLVSHSAVTGAIDDVALGDLDGDRDLDAVIANGTAISVLLNDGSGGLVQTSQAFLLCDGCSLVALADLDRDGLSDLVAIDTQGDLAHVYRNLGAGELSSPTTLELGRGAAGIALDDVDNDGAPDLVLAHQTDGTVMIFQNRGDATFELREALAFAGAARVAVGDLDADGRPELAVTSTRSSSLQVFRSRVDGSWVGQAYLGLPMTRAIAIADLTGDATLDLAITNEEGRVAVLSAAACP